MTSRDARARRRYETGLPRETEGFGDNAELQRHLWKSVLRDSFDYARRSGNIEDWLNHQMFYGSPLMSEIAQEMYDEFVSKAVTEKLIK